MNAVSANILRLLRAAMAICLAVFAGFVADAEVKIDWLEGVHDFGAFNEDDGRVSCEFRFVNTGDEAVSIVAARPTCGCTASDFTRGAVEPSDTAVISVTYDPTGRPGRFEKKVYVDLSSPDIPRTTLRITGVVIGSSNTLRSRYPVDAGALKMRSTVLPFGEVTAGRAKSTFFEVYNATPDTITPRWEGLPPYLTVSSVSPSVPPGEQTAYSAMMVPDRVGLYGIVVDSVYVRPRPGDEPVKVDVVANVREDFSRLTPGQLQSAPRAVLPSAMADFGTFSPDEPLHAVLKLENKGKSELRVRRVYTNAPGVSVSVKSDKVKKGKSTDIIIDVDPRQLPSELLNARIIVITNDPEDPEQIIRVVGIPR